MFRLESPHYIYLVGILPLLILTSIVLTKMQKKKLEKYFKSDIFQMLTKNISFTKRKWKFFFEILALLFLIIALARPQFGESVDKIKMEGIEIVIALDVSNSMMSEDIRPSRLIVAKNSINKLLSRISGFKVGLVAFAGSAGLISPLTTDYSSIRMFLDTISPDTISTQGTNISAALKMADEAFNRGGVDEDETTKVTRVVLIISDGEDHDQLALKEANKFTSGGTRIFSMGVGTEQGGPIPERDDFGQLKGYKKDKSHNVVVSKVNTEFLRKLAGIGKGAYFHATFSGDEIKQMETELNKLEKTEFNSELSRKYNERFSNPPDAGDTFFNIRDDIN